jgi:hypothetical protein
VKEPRRNGFTLVETIFSSLFIGIAFLAIINLFPGAYLSIRKSEMQIQADIIARSVLDEVRITPFNELDEEGEYPYDPDRRDDEPFADKTLDNVKYETTVTIYRVPDTVDFAVVKGVKVTVEYRNLNDFTGAKKAYVLDTYIHKLVR